MEQTQFTQGGWAQILVVEDERIVAHDLAGTLTELGYFVPAVVASGEEAVRKAGELRPDLALMDIRLADSLDGVQAGEATRKEHNIPEIYLTAHHDEETLRRTKPTQPYGCPMNTEANRD